MGLLVSKIAWDGIALRGLRALDERVPARGAARRDLRQREHALEIVVGRDAAVALEPAGQAAVDDHVLAFRPGESADRRHQSTTVARAIARRIAVHVARVQAVGAVIAMLASGDGRPDKQATGSTAELVGLGGPAVPGRSTGIRSRQRKHLLRR